LSFLGGVDTSNGIILDPECPLIGESVRGRILCFPFGIGSTVGSYAIYQLKLNKVAPRAIINQSAEPIVATGAIMSEIPMVDNIDISLIATGDRVAVNAADGTVELRDVTERHVVTSILRNRGRILILKRSDKVGSYRGSWAGVSGFVEKDETYEEAARREIVEETGLGKVRFSRMTPSRSFRDDDSVWTIHPFLFDVSSRKVSIDWEHDAYAWIVPDELKEYSTVPGLHAVIKNLLEPTNL